MHWLPLVALVASGAHEAIGAIVVLGAMVAIGGHCKQLQSNKTNSKL